MEKRKSIMTAILMAAVMTAAGILAGCGGSSGSDAAQTGSTAAGTTAESTAQGELADGEYSAVFTTDSSMFAVNEACKGLGRLTVRDGAMTIHISLKSTHIVNLFAGTAEDAQKDGAELLQPTEDTIYYEDGTSETVYGFDVPVPAIDEEFDLALIGTKGKWYDHKVKVSDPVKNGEVPGYTVSSEAGTGSESGSAQTETSETGSAEDKAAANKAAALIDAIYVQERTDKTDEQCSQAKEAWDALTDTQKALVYGEYADPDYFGLDTGDASKDDPLNQDNIGENELLVVSFGTSFNDSRVKDIGGIEKALQAAYPDWSVRRAFTSQIIINHIQARDGETIDNMDQALERAVSNGVKNLVIQPTHLMHGAEYDELSEAAENFKDKFDSLKIAEPLLGEVGSDASKINEDKEEVAEDVTEAAVEDAGYDSLEAAEKDCAAFVFLGHGTSHTANVTYDQMQTQMEKLGYKNVFIGTVEGSPADTVCEAVIEKVKKAGYKKVILRPLMVVAGDHAHNDMAGDDSDSWKSQFEASGAFDSVECQIKGLGEIPDVQELYVQHSADAGVCV